MERQPNRHRGWLVVIVAVVLGLLVTLFGLVQSCAYQNFHETNDVQLSAAQPLIDDDEVKSASHWSWIKVNGGWQRFWYDVDGMLAKGRVVPDGNQSVFATDDGSLLVAAKARYADGYVIADADGHLIEEQGTYSASIESDGTSHTYIMGPIDDAGTIGAMVGEHYLIDGKHVYIDPSRGYVEHGNWLDGTTMFATDRDGIVIKTYENVTPRG